MNADRIDPKMFDFLQRDATAAVVRSADPGAVAAAMLEASPDA